MTDEELSDIKERLSHFDAAAHSALSRHLVSFLRDDAFALLAEIERLREASARQAASLRATAGMNEHRRIEIIRLEQVIAKLKGEPLPPTGA